MQVRVDDLSCDTRLLEAADEILEAGSCTVSKPIRAGFTTSAIMASERRGWRAVVVEPTTRILKQTVDTASGRAVRVPGNGECPKNRADIEAHPLLSELPMSIEGCEDCPGRDRCPVLTILRVPDYETAGLTYAKVEALMLSKGDTAKAIVSKLRRADLVLLDEAHLISLPSVVSVKVFSSVEVPPRFKVLSRLAQAWIDLCAEHVDLVTELQVRAEEGFAGQHLAKSVLRTPLSWKRLKAAWGELRSLAMSGEVEDAVVLQIRDIISILGSNQVAFSFLSEDGGTGGAVYASAGRARFYRALREFLQGVVPHARHVFGSGTLFEPEPGFFRDLSGSDRWAGERIFPDVREAGKKVTVVPDTWTLTGWNFRKKLPAILGQIKAIAARERQPIYLLAGSGLKAGILREGLAKMGLPGVFVDYYRSDRSLGVERSERVCIAVGMGEVPANACDSMVWGKDEDTRWLKSRKLRRQAVDAATWQAVNRCRDPTGETESRIYFIGCRLDRVRQVATWGTNRRLELVEIRQTEGTRWPIFSVKFDDGIEVPKIVGEDQHDTHSNRRTVADFVGQIDFYEDKIKNSENRANPSIDMYRDNGAKVRIFNIPHNKSELDSTATALYQLFCNREDCFAQQYQNSKSARWEFSKVLSPLTVDRLISHVKGDVTLGAYEIALDDTVSWSCVDIDSHNGETDARDKVAAVVAVLRQYAIPYLLEASGSELSYHIWILLARTRTYNAYRFIRQVISEAGVSCEVWPKQKSLHDKNGKFGNLVKLPICYHRKSGGRSAFLDADTFEPLEGPISHPGLVHLVVVPDLSGDSLAMPKGRRPSAGKAKVRIPDTELDYCMRRALEQGLPLEGSDGHHLRLAIAIKAHKIGMSEEESACLFKGQVDYDHDFSLNKVLETWAYDYSPWSCDTLRDKCDALVTRFCSTCPMGKKRYATEAKA